MNAGFKQLLMDRKSVIVQTWYEAFFATPAGSASEFPEKQRNVLAGSAYRDPLEGLEAVFVALVQGLMKEDTSRFLDSIVAVRAADAVTASRSLDFFLALKKAVRRELGSGILNDPQWSGDLAAWDAVVDDMLLFAFNRFTEHRETVFERNAEEERKRTYRLLRKAGLISDEGE